MPITPLMQLTRTHSRRECQDTSLTETDDSGPFPLKVCGAAICRILMYLLTVFAPELPPSLEKKCPPKERHWDQKHSYSNYVNLTHLPVQGRTVPYRYTHNSTLKVQQRSVVGGENYWRCFSSLLSLPFLLLFLTVFLLFFYFLLLLRIFFILIPFRLIFRLNNSLCASFSYSCISSCSLPSTFSFSSSTSSNVRSVIN